MALEHLIPAESADIRIVRDALVEMKTSIKSADLLPCELLSRIPADAERHKYVAGMLDQCRKNLETHPRSTLVPLYPVLEDRDMLQGTFR